MKKTNKQLIVFIKHPLAGKCKTRLIPFLSAEQASEFYKSLVKICFDNISLLSEIDIAVYAYPDSTHPFIQNINQAHNATLHNQKGDDLGERMQHAISSSLETYSQCVLIGTDCPLINATYINDAFKSLRQHDMVFGPAEDGGYVLVGATKINKNIFSKINWSTSQVLQQNLNNTKAASFNTHLLKTLWDIDTPEDYIKYQSLINQTAITQE